MMNGWAVITGAGSGIGAALARRLARASVNVVVVGRRGAQLDRTVAEVARDRAAAAAARSPAPTLPPLPAAAAGQHGGQHGACVPCVCDIASPDAARLISDSLPAGAALHYLVHNAAIGDPGQAPDIDVAHFRHALEVNVVAPLAITQALLPRLRQAALAAGGGGGGGGRPPHAGRVLHLGTGVAHHVQRGTGTYGVSKLAFHRLYQQLSADLQPTGVLVGSARPGVVETEGMVEHVRKATAMELPHADYFKTLFAGRGAGLQDMGVVAAFLHALLTECPGGEFGAREWSVNDKADWWGGSDKALLTGASKL